jgi:hypothetical protein
VSKPALGPTQPRIQWVLGVVTPGVRRSVREADRLPPYSAEAKNAWSYVSTPVRLRDVARKQEIRLHGVVLN